MIPPEQVDRVVVLVERRVRTALPQAHRGVPIRVFPVSAREALLAKLERNTPRLHASRFEAFEAAIERFLVRDRGVAVIQVANEAVAGISVQIAQAASAELSRCELDMAAREASLGDRIAALHALATQTKAMRASFSERAQKIHDNEVGELSDLACDLLLAEIRPTRRYFLQ